MTRSSSHAQGTGERPASTTCHPQDPPAFASCRPERGSCPLGPTRSLSASRRGRSSRCPRVRRPRAGARWPAEVRGLACAPRQGWWALDGDGRLHLLGRGPQGPGQRSPATSRSAARPRRWNHGHLGRGRCGRSCCSLRRAGRRARRGRPSPHRFRGRADTPGRETPGRGWGSTAHPVSERPHRASAGGIRFPRRDVRVSSTTASRPRAASCHRRAPDEAAPRPASAGPRFPRRGGRLDAERGAAGSRTRSIGPPHRRSNGRCSATTWTGSAPHCSGR